MSNIDKKPTSPQRVGASRAKKEKIVAKLSEKARVLHVAAGADGRIDWQDLLRQLGQQNICSILVEGGSAVHGSALDAGVVDKVYGFVAPKLMGGAGALSPIGGQGASTMSGLRNLKRVSTQILGDDWVFRGYL